MPHVRYFEPDLAECQVLAKQLPSALPGSFLRLAEVVGERVRVWMHFDATALAANRLELLRQIDTSLSAPSFAAERVSRLVKRCAHGCADGGSQDVDLVGSLRELAEAMNRVRPGITQQVRSASEVVLSDEDAGLTLFGRGAAEAVEPLSSLWMRAVSVASSEARMLAIAWRAVDRTLADEFAAMAETLGCRLPPPSTPRVRRPVQELDVRRPAGLVIARRHA